MKIGQIQLAKNNTTELFKIGAGVVPGSEAAVIAQKLIETLGTDVLFLNRPDEEIDRLVAFGKIDASTAAERKAKVPGFVKRNVNLSVSKG